MKHYGITGIIGSGKSTVAKVLEWLGGARYDSDATAKYLMENSKELKNELIGIFGNSVFVEDKLNRDLIRKQIFKDDSLKTKIDMLVHPMVWKDYLTWREKQKTHFTIMESALLLKNNRTEYFEAIIYVESDVNLCIERVIKRSDLPRIMIENIIKNQIVEYQELNDCKLLHINNKGTKLVLPQCNLLYKIL